MVCHFVVLGYTAHRHLLTAAARFMAWLCGGGVPVSSHPSRVIG